MWIRTRPAAYGSYTPHCLTARYGDGEYDLALANVTAGVVASSAGSLARVLRENVLLIASGILEERREEGRSGAWGIVCCGAVPDRRRLVDRGWRESRAYHPNRRIPRDHKIDA